MNQEKFGEISGSIDDCTLEESVMSKDSNMYSTNTSGTHEICNDVSCINYSF